MSSINQEIRGMLLGVLNDADAADPFIPMMISRVCFGYLSIFSVEIRRRILRYLNIPNDLKVTNILHRNTERLLTLDWFD